MRNCVVFRAGGRRLAVELRWVREVITMGPITRVRHSSPCIVGATQVHGTILPVVSAAAVAGGVTNAARCEVGVLIDVGGSSIVLAIPSVDEIATLRVDGDDVTDGRGDAVEMLQPNAVIDVVRRGIHAAMEGFQ